MRETKAFKEMMKAVELVKNGMTPKDYQMQQKGFGRGAYVAPPITTEEIALIAIRNRELAEQNASLATKQAEYDLRLISTNDTRPPDTKANHLVPHYTPPKRDIQKAGNTRGTKFISRMKENKRQVCLSTNGDEAYATAYATTVVIRKPLSSTSGVFGTTDSFSGHSRRNIDKNQKIVDHAGADFRQEYIHQIEEGTITPMSGDESKAYSKRTKDRYDTLQKEMREISKSLKDKGFGGEQMLVDTKKMKADDRMKSTPRQLIAVGRFFGSVSIFKDTCELGWTGQLGDQVSDIIR